MNGIWIRTQDRKDLILIVEAHVYEKYVNSEGDTLGFYKTPERALEVLDEIMTAIYIDRPIYEMPKE
jgi:hypothetical protein